MASVAVGVALLGACSHRRASPPGDDAGSDGDDAGSDGDGAGPATCAPIDEQRGQCRTPLGASFCAETWATRDAPMCGLRVYEGPGAGYLLQYVSYNDIPPLGGPSWMCVYAQNGSRSLVGAWALDHYLRWCCGQSLDLFQGVATDEIANLAASMATHPLCPDAGP